MVGRFCGSRRRRWEESWAGAHEVETLRVSIRIVLPEDVRVRRKSIMISFVFSEAPVLHEVQLKQTCLL